MYPVNLRQATDGAIHILPLTLGKPIVRTRSDIHEISK